MEVKRINDGLRNDWEEYVIANPYSIPGQCYSWIDIIKKHYTAEFYPFAAFDGNKIVGVLPLYLVMGKFISAPYAVNGGILGDNKEAEKLLLEEAIVTAKKKGINSIVLRQYKKRIDGDLKVNDDFFNKELNIDRPSSDIWADLEDRNKEKLEKINFSKYWLDMSNKDIDIFYKILKYYHHKKGIPCVSKKWVYDLYDLKIYDIAFLKKGNNILAATMIKKFVKAVSFPFSCPLGLSKENMNNMYILYWMLFQNYRDAGYKIFHSGRIPKNKDTDRYRLGWGGNQYSYLYHYYPNTETKSDYKNKRGVKRKIFQSLWKIAPSVFTDKIGEKIVERFP